MAGDAEIFEAIADILKSIRRSGSVALRQRNIIVLESSQSPKRSNQSAKARHR